MNPVVIGECQLYLGDALEILPTLPESSYARCVADPPYGIRFMGKAWDGDDIEAMYEDRLRYSQDSDPRAGTCGGHRSRAAQAGKYNRSRDASKAFQVWCEVWALELLRVLKPGSPLLAFGGTRTFHRLTCALEDAGFEIRDCLMWLYGSGFPKSLDVSESIDKAAGAEREVVGRRTDRAATPKRDIRGGRLIGADTNIDLSAITAPATDAAKQWDGWGTALKPAWEPIILARKPLEGTVAENVLKWGTGALNIDGCRIEGPKGDGVWGGSNAIGRWPANVILDEAAAAMLDEQSGPQKSGGTPFKGRYADKTRNTFGIFTGQENPNGIGPSAGLVSRFFYCAKASRGERNMGLDRTEPFTRHGATLRKIENAVKATGTIRNDHPTVKPMRLMEYLLRLTNMPGPAPLIDPFMGSGTTLVAAARLGIPAVGIEREEKSFDIACHRIADAVKQGRLPFLERSKAEQLRMA